ncbi:hypothetical protein K493DRAFT_60044 [Basidiobolus meristosporus CBS 931.73]|uniref:Uncharacterized protein n=1 Tax=Basidiobolus meristosporus CBS 931.73 TaxID=1314790 RepID=A0A1Y1XX59_9FUNG|nr:hypothetical protein K493DRAFT_60044 [Basidiobolus meristosporus CBS 931.73]|eukprot:ORX90330.1 hypothetical protein K493DRAFT_60044 [Basidiobolus meristosporus CBS 931.73]
MMTEPTTPSEHLERQTSLSQEGQKSLNSPPLSKALKTPSPGFVSKIPIPARLVKERSPSTSPTAVIGSKASFTEQNEHWRQYRPVSNPTTPVSSNEDSLSFIKNTPKDESASENLNQATTPDAKEKSSFSGENDHSELK